MSTRDELLEVIEAGRLDWIARGLAGTVFRLWTPNGNRYPVEYRLLTRAERKELKAMRADGMVKLEPGWQTHKGMVRLAQPHLFTE